MIMVPNMETADTSIVSVAPRKPIYCQIYRSKIVHCILSIEKQNWFTGVLCLISNVEPKIELVLFMLQEIEHRSTI